MSELESVRFAVAMRLGRAALGMNQQEFADLLGVSKSTVARNETMEMAMRAETLTTMLRVLRENGVEVDVLNSAQTLSIEVHAPALEHAWSRLADEDQRRSDRHLRRSKSGEDGDPPLV